MSEHHFWLADDPFNRLKPLSPNKGRGVPRVDDRKVIHVIRYGLRWRDAPACYGPHKTLYNRFVRWSRAAVSSTASFSPLLLKAPPPRRS